ncbi:hypothetical protein TruAng_011461 [Truncatella angustata]|nr:hypothetical protein TruAng_011461 [Truncatella angustata]
MAAPNPANNDLRIEVITDGADFEPAHACIGKCFGDQTSDGVWILMSPGWDTTEGNKRLAARLRDRWQETQQNNNTIFLKATLPDPDAQGARRIVGVAIWVNASKIPGEGEVPGEVDYAALYPEDEGKQRFLKQAMASLHKQRYQVLEEKARPESKQKSIMVLDLCVTDPAYQRRGIARRLVQWGLDEAKRRGDLEATTEGSAMGRHVYRQLGFQGVSDIVWEVDDEFKNYSLPPNLFMRTRPSDAL